jgi:hypothetical protein
VIGLSSCKKDAKTETTPPASVTRDFYMAAYDENGNQIATLSGNIFTVNFYQNNNLVYSVKTQNLQLISGCCYHSFSISNFKDGAYLCEIKDSLNLFGYFHDSLVCKNGF